MSRWLLEIKAGVFVGKLSALVRDELWTYITEKLGEGQALMVYGASTEQGFLAQSVGDRSRMLEDIDGILLVKIP